MHVNRVNKNNLSHSHTNTQTDNYCNLIFFVIFAKKYKFNVGFNDAMYHSNCNLLILSSKYLIILEYSNTAS